jgi:hypothetical protein
MASRWEDVDVEKLLTCENFKDEIKALTNVPHDLVDRWSDIQLFPLFTAMSFLTDLELYPVVEALTIEKEPFEQFELCRSMMEAGKIYVRAIAAAKVYYPEEKSATRLLGYGVHIIGQVHTFLKFYEEMFKAEPEGDAEIAGIEKLAQFGSWGRAYILSGRDLIKTRELFKLPAIEVYTALLYNFREAKYQKALHEIQVARAKVNAKTKRR